MNKQLLTLILFVWLGTMESGWCFYNPQPGRWFSRDPIEDRNQECTPYCFVGNGVPDKVDKLGLLSVYVHPLPVSPGRPQGSPASGPCGAFEVFWGFSLNNASATGGWIMQIVTFKHRYATCGLQPVARDEVRYEGFRVSAGGNHPQCQDTQNVWDEFSTLPRPNTFGSFIISAEAKFFSDTVPQIAGLDWPVQPNECTLPVVTTTPTGWDQLWAAAPTEGSVTHEVWSAWNCCCSPNQNNLRFQITPALP